MSSPNSHTQYKAYQPLTANTEDENMAVAATKQRPSSHRIGQGGSSSTMPLTYSSQQLMPPSDSDSMEENSERGSRPGADISSIERLNAGADTGRFNQSHWFTVGVLCFVNLINYMDRFTIAGVLDDIQNDFQIGDDDGGLLQTAFVISYMIFAPAFGYFGDRYSRRIIMAVGVALWCTTTFLGSYMPNFGWFITFRALVGIGEASYSTIAPTIISDLFVSNMRSKMLAMFYFAIPVGSGLGYIVGSETARMANNWRWALRVTPFLGILAVILLLIIKDPVRGESEGSHNMEVTSYKEDLKDLCKNRSFMLSTAGFTCVAFVTGALAWWGPKFIHLGLKNLPGNEDLKINDVSYKFGIVAMIAGLIGVPLGSWLAQIYRSTIENCDPYICAFGVLTSAPMVYFALILPQTSEAFCFIFVFLAQLTLNMCWSLVADILLYVVVPTRRSTAEAFQILISHMFGDAGSPYLVGLFSELIKKHLREANRVVLSNSATMEVLSQIKEATNVTANAIVNVVSSTMPPEALALTTDQDTTEVKFQALQYALFSTCFVEVLGGVFFLLTAAFILGDKRKASDQVRESQRPRTQDID